MGRLTDYPIQPGFSRPDTRRKAKGRWYDGTLVRWYEGIMQAIGGWEKLQQSSPTVGDVALGGPARGMIAWRGNEGSAQLAMGTHAKLWHFAGGALTDITPAGFIAGLVDAAEASGLYGRGPYGVGLYSYGDASQSSIVEANTWQLDTYGEDLLACAYSDGRIYKRSKQDGGVAAPVDNAPVNCLGVVVTEQRFVVALGAGGDGRRIEWCDQENITDWTPTTENQAGGWNLTGKGLLMGGLRSRKETLIWTDDALYGMVYIGGDNVYTFPERGTKCGPISRRAMAVVDGHAIWMGKRSFFKYDGYVAPLPSEVGDYVFSDINRDQASKIAVRVQAEFGEVTWHYPSALSTENDRYVTVNYRENIWYFGDLERTAGVDSEVFGVALAGDAQGNVYEHEEAATYLDPAGATLTPTAESGPVELGNDQYMRVQRLVPDEVTLGGVQLTLLSSDSPTGSETTQGPYSASQPVDTRFEAKLVRVRITQVLAGWRFGTLQIEVEPGGRR